MKTKPELVGAAEPAPECVERIAPDMFEAAMTAGAEADRLQAAQELAKAELDVAAAKVKQHHLAIVRRYNLRPGDEYTPEGVIVRKPKDEPPISRSTRPA